MRLGTKQQRIIAALIVALGAITVGLVMVLLSPAAADGGQDQHSKAGWIALVPIYTSLVSIYIAAARRRKNKKIDG